MATLLATAAGLLMVRIDTRVQSFVPESDPSVVALQEHARLFGADPIVVLLESSAPHGMFSPEALPRLVGLEGQLARLPDVAVVYGPGTGLNQMAAEAQALIGQITGRRDALRTGAEQRAAEKSAQDISEAVDQSTADFDHRYGSLLVQGFRTGLPTLRNPAFAQNVIFDDSGAPRHQWRFVVPSADAVAVLVRPRENLDQTGTARLVASVRAQVDRSGLPIRQTTMTGLPSVTVALGETVPRELPLLGGAAFAVVALCFGLAPGLGSRRRRFLPLLVAVMASGLVLAGAGWLRMPLSLGVIAFLPVLFSITSYYLLYLTSASQRRRVVVAALASAASFASLGFSPAPFVKELGWTLAAGVLVAVAVSLLLVRLVPDGLVAEEPDPPPAPCPSSPKAKCLAALVVFSAVSAGGWFALPHIAIQADPLKLASGLDAITVAERAEGVLGSSGDISIVLHGPNVLTPDALRWSRDAQTALTLAHGDLLRLIMSAPDVFRFLGDNPTQQQIDSAAQLVPPYLTGSVVSGDRQQSLLTFGLSLRDLGPRWSSIEQIGAALPPPPAGYRADIVGLPVVAARGVELVSEGRVIGNVTGIGAAALVLLLGLRRRRDALLAVLASTLATGWGLMLIWLLDLELSPLTVALGSLTAAAGGEFTVLLLNSGRRSSSLSRSVGVAALASAGGFLVLLGSRLEIMRQFGLYLTGAVVLSYLAAKVVTRLWPDRSGTGPGWRRGRLVAGISS